jgi:hypothetical protein
VSTLYGTEFFAGRSATVALSAAAVAPVVTSLVHPRSLLDLGCGQGEWVDAFGLNDSLGVDIAAPDRPGFVVGDLTELLDLQRTYELVLCLEVGEHLPEAAAPTLADTVARHADTLLFSAAVPGQEGTGHINCQPHEYWHELFAERGLQAEDSVRPLIAHDSRVSPWYRNNLYLYVRRSP